MVATKAANGQDSIQRAGGDGGSLRVSHVGRAWRAAPHYESFDNSNMRSFV